MRLNSLRLQNFRQHADTLVEFDSGITGIIGANGSGKTTILEAIAWALYGNAAARGNRDSIRFNRAGARAAVRVELDFELSGHRYRVARGLTSAELFLDGAAQPIANSISGVSDLLQRRLGMSRSEFFNTYFTGQKELNVMAAMGPTERGQFLSRVLGYEKLRAAQAMVRNRRKLLVAEMDGLRGGMPDAEVVVRNLTAARDRLAAAEAAARQAAARRSDADHALAAVAPRWDAAQASRERWQQLQSELRVLESELTAARRDEGRADRDFAEAVAARDRQAALAATLAPLAALRTELAALDLLAREEGRRQALERSAAAAESDAAQLRARVAKLESAPGLEREAIDALARARIATDAVERELEERRTVWVRDRQEAETKRDALRRQWAELAAQRDRLAELGPESPCPTCTRPLGDGFRGVLDMLDEQVDTVTVDGNYYKDRLEQLAETPEQIRDLDDRRRVAVAEAQGLERRLAKIQAAVHELSIARHDVADKESRTGALRAELAGLPTGYDAAQHRTVRVRLEEVAPLELEAGRLTTLADRAPRLAEELERATARAAELDTRAADTRARIAAVPLDEAGYQRLRREHDDAAAAVRSAELAAVQSEGERGGARQAVESSEREERELKRVQERLAGLQRDRRMHEELDRAYNDLRTDLNFQLRPELSEIASAFLAELTDARYSELELDDQYNVIVLEDGVPKPVISGGEEDLANLVLRLAISQLIAERAGQSFSLLVLDEVFGSLDESRRLNVVELLRKLQDRFEQIVLITHIESVRDGVDRVIEVTLDEERGTSIVRQLDGGAPRDGTDLAFEVVGELAAVAPDGMGGPSLLSDPASAEALDT